MKNPQITTKLNQLMRDEKLNAITVIMDHYKVFNPKLHTSDTFDTLYDMYLDELNNVLSDCISQIYAECNKFVTTRK